MKVTRKLLELTDQVLEKLGLQQYSHRVYEILDKINARGYDAQTAVATAIYVVCKENAVPITITKICKVAGASQEGVFRLLKKHGLMGVSAEPPEKYVPKIIEQLGIQDRAVEQSAMEFLKQMSNNRAYHPITKAVTAVYLACKKHGFKVTQQKLQELTGVSDVAIRCLLREVEDNFT